MNTAAVRLPGFTLPRRSATAFALVAGMGLLLVLQPMTRSNFLLFHLIVELSIIGLSIAIATVAWNTRHLVDDDAFLALGLGYLGIAMLTLLHTLAYKGMNLLATAEGANMATQFWVAARYQEGLAFLLFPLTLRRRLGAPLHLLLWGVLPTLFALAILLWRIFPDCFVEGKGLTGFKIASEYLFCLTGLVTLALLHRQRHHLHPGVGLLFAGGVTLSIAGELVFTLYTTVTGPLIVAGHYLHLFSVFLIYKALVHSSLQRPLETLFRSLNRKENLLAARLRVSEMSAALPLDQLLVAAIDEAENLTGSSIGFFHFVDREKMILSRKAWSRNTADTCLVREGDKHLSSAETCLLIEKLERQGQVILNDFQSQPDPALLPGGHIELRRVMIVPVLREGRLLAMCGVGNKETDYDGNDVELVAALGDLAWDIILRKQTETALRHSEEQFRLSFERSPVGTMMLTPEFRFLRSNACFCRMIGYSESELAGMSFATITHPEERQRDLLQTQRLLAGEIDAYDVEKRYIHKDGHVVWARVNVTLVRGDEGEPLFFLPIVEDITSAKVVEGQLSERTAYLQAIFRSSPVGIGVVHERVISEANTRLTEITGYPAEEMLGQSARMLYPSEEDFRWVGEEKYRQIERHGTGSVETRWRRKDGRVIDVLLSSTPIDIADLDKGVTFSALDISERKEAERRLRERSDFIRRVLDSTDAHIAILDADGIIIDVNTPWIRFGLACGIADLQAISPGANYFASWQGRSDVQADLSAAEAGIRQVQRGERDTFQFDYACHSCSEKRWFTMRVLPLSGTPGQVLVAHTDITPLKQSEEELTSAVSEKDVLLREVHHRVKNNLAAVVSLLDMQRRLLGDDQSGEMLVELGNRIRSMSLIHEKLYRSPNLARIDFPDYLRSLVTHLRTSFGATHVDCRIEATGVALPLDVAVPCGMIVNELVTNVMKHAFPGGRPAPGRDRCEVLVEMDQKEGRCTLHVADNGIGLPAHVDWEGVKTLGMVLIRMLGRHQLGGDYTFASNQGLSVTLTFQENRGRL